MRNANWKADYLASHVTISEATLHTSAADDALGSGRFLLRPAEGDGEPHRAGELPCRPRQQPCPPQFQMQFGDLDAAAVQTAILGAREKGTLLSDLIDRFASLFRAGMASA